MTSGQEMEWVYSYNLGACTGHGTIQSRKHRLQFNTSSYSANSCLRTSSDRYGSRIRWNSITPQHDDLDCFTALSILLISIRSTRTLCNRTALTHSQTAG